MRHSLSKDTAFNGETAPSHTFLCSDLQCLPLAIPESCAQNMGLRLLENHSFRLLVISQDIVGLNMLLNTCGGGKVSKIEGLENMQIFTIYHY